VTGTDGIDVPLLGVTRSAKKIRNILSPMCFFIVGQPFGSRKKNETFAELAIRYGKNLDAGDKLAEKSVFV
jgi:hypothetical protein